MSKISLSGNASGTGTLTIAAPNTNSNYTLDLPTSSGTMVVTGGAQTIEFGAGSASTPSITFTGDTNTGIFSPTADTVGIATGGSERMRIDSSGNVGIGTTSPAEKLHVSGNLALGTNGEISNNVGEKIIFKNSDDTIVFQTSSVERMLINTTGNVKLAGNLGLGGTSPSSSGTGITFPATQNASSDANTLDDYEEGTFTATITGSSSGSGTPAATTKYIKIGQQVTVWCRFENVTFPTYSGNLEVSLPFTASSTNTYPVGPLCYYYPNANWDTLANFVGIRAVIYPAGAKAQFSYKLVDQDWQNLITAANTTTSNTANLYLEFTITYYTA